MSDEKTTLQVDRPAWSDQTDKLWPAMLAARKSMPVFEKGAKAKIEKGGKVIYTVDYLDLAILSQAAGEELADHGMLWWTTTEALERTTRVISYITHESGQWFRAEAALPAPTDAWGVGSMLTFLRRYLLLAQLGMHPHGEDDNAKAAQRGRREDVRLETAQAQAAQVQAKSAAARKDAYRKALTAEPAREKWGKDYGASGKAVDAFALAAFEAKLGDLDQERFEVAMDYLSFGGDLPPDYLDNDLVMSTAVRDQVAAWMGRGKVSSAEDERMELLRAACGPDTEPEDGVEWAEQVMGEDALTMPAGKRLDTVRLFLHVSEHGALQDAIGKLGGGDVTAGVDALWRELGASVDVLLATGAGEVVEQLEQIGGAS